MSINWDDPAARFHLIERVGPAEYERLQAEHLKASTVAVVNGHAIRPVGSRFGRLFSVGSTGKAFSIQADAEAAAASEPPGTDEAPDEGESTSKPAPRG
jgi:hypothetical protein